MKITRLQIRKGNKWPDHYDFKELFLFYKKRHFELTFDNKIIINPKMTETETVSPASEANSNSKS